MLTCDKSDDGKSADGKSSDGKNATQYKKCVLCRQTFHFDQLSLIGNCIKSTAYGYGQPIFEGLKYRIYFSCNPLKKIMNFEMSTWGEK